MTTKPNAKNDDRAAISTELHKDACTCYQGFNRSLMLCDTCQRLGLVYESASTRLGGDYVAN